MLYFRYYLDDQPTNLKPNCSQSVAHEREYVMLITTEAWPYISYLSQMGPCEEWLPAIHTWPRNLLPCYTNHKKPQWI